MFVKIDGLLQPAISWAFGRTFPGLGFGITIAVILAAGFIVSNVNGRKIITFSESLLYRLPVVRQLYQGTKQIIDSFTPAAAGGRFLQVVLVEFPRAGMKTLAFVTNEAQDDSGKVYLNILIPTAPNPTSGFLQIVSEDDVIRTDISVDDALKMIMSAGKVSAKDITLRLNKNVPGVIELEKILEEHTADTR